MEQTEKSDNIRLKGMLGLACRARGLVTGTELSVESVRNGRCVLMLIASDASGNSRKKIVNCCEYYGVRLCETGLTKEDFASCIGRGAEVSAAALTNANFAEPLIKLCEEIVLHTK